VTVTGAAGNIGYVLVHMIGQGRLLGPYQPISLTLVELPFAQQQLEGTLMELKDCALPLLKEIHGTTDYKEGFKGA
jgi:malate/lactate dehydrogenase